MEHHGKRVEEIRKLRGLPKTELAERIGKANSTIHDILGRKEISYDLLEKLGKALDFDFKADFFQPKGEVVEESQSPYGEEYFKEKYIMEGRIQQMNELLASSLGKEIIEMVENQLENQITTLSNQVQSLIQKTRDLEELYQKINREGKSA